MDTEIFDLLEKAAKKREPLKSCTNALRLVNGYGDELDGLVIEQYNRHLVAHIYDNQWLQRKKVLLAFAKKYCEAKYFIVKDRTEFSASQSDASKFYVWLEDESSQTIVEENGLKFSVDLNDSINSGLFLDMRYNRKLVSELALGRKVLNCFAYTCSFGVYCRKAKALSVINVDISKKSLRRGQVNYELNQLVPEKNELIYADAVKYLNRAVEISNKFDLIILDPPSFARHDGKSFSVKKDLVDLVASAMKVLNPNGYLFLSTNFSEISHDYLEDMVCSVVPAWKIKKIQRLEQDDDFVGSGSMPESYLAAILVGI